MLLSYVKAGRNTRPQGGPVVSSEKANKPQIDGKPFSSPHESSTWWPGVCFHGNGHLKACFRVKAAVAIAYFTMGCGGR